MNKVTSGAELLSRLHEEVRRAGKTVYDVGKVTPLERIGAEDCNLYLKREDLSPMHAYKWRGAYHRMAQLDPHQTRGVVAASAGNHAQGVAIAAAKMGGVFETRIFMPLNTPLMKQRAVRQLGGEAVSIELVGDRYDEALEAAQHCADQEGYVLVHAFDDLVVMGGQGTIGDEIAASGEGPFDAAFLQIGGGGMAAGVAARLRHHFPDIVLYGVEGQGQASMKAAVEAGQPVRLQEVDVFCDGTAVAIAGQHTFPLCRDLIDRFLTVTNEEVCAAMQYLWERKRIIPEPAGAMGLAGWLAHRSDLPDHKNILVLICGANMDFAQLQRVVRGARIGSETRRYLRFEIEERAGTLHQLLSELRIKANIVEFQYGKTDQDKAWPVIGLEAGERSFRELYAMWEETGLIFEDLTGEIDVEFRAFPFEPTLLEYPLFLEVEFSERAGALADFLEKASNLSDLVYFDYQYSGERVGRALIGFDFGSQEARDNFLLFTETSCDATRKFKALSESQMKRILAR